MRSSSTSTSSSTDPGTNGNRIVRCGGIAAPTDRGRSARRKLADGLRRRPRDHADRRWSAVGGRSPEGALDAPEEPRRPRRRGTRPSPSASSSCATSHAARRRGAWARGRRRGRAGRHYARSSSDGIPRPRASGPDPAATRWRSRPRSRLPVSARGRSSRAPPRSSSARRRVEVVAVPLDPRPAAEHATSRRRRPAARRATRRALRRAHGSADRRGSPPGRRSRARGPRASARCPRTLARRLHDAA